MSEKPDYSHLWNDLPFDERERLMPYQIQAQILHLRQARTIMLSGHRKSIASLDEWIENLERDLAKLARAHPKQP